MKKGIIIFQKNAELGKVKTRLAASVGDHQALEIYKTLIYHTYLQIQSIDAEKLVYFSEYVEPDFKKNENLIHFFIQSKGDLGEKMSNAFRNQFEKGFDKLLIIGTDCPEITSEIVDKAFLHLENSEVVIGPAKDGGYYLLGMNRFIPGIFKNIKWSSDQVLKSTKLFLESNKINHSFLPILSDVDHLEDWELFKDKLIQTK
ncbi:TIGR04282 family arsenosugar biosynthesis glycosyltransferase [Algoriphagus sp.]|uniref:TIGR04282 family arsenosugar biosynthesis glycosyltransferase n=1 Tax=Algoriphagus sp. TaxID=1872435 RepID=UPI0025D26818|nr:TIGR04282 family arsenosugar biosynthesis glycosyltransferase [Algoriphagus sp.]